MTKKVSIALLLLIVIVTSITLFSCKQNEPQELVLFVGTTAVVDSLNRLDVSGGAPGYNFDKIASTVSQLSAVSKIDGDYVGVACDFSITENGRKVTLTQKSGYKWHDGQPVTIDNLEYTINSSYLQENYEIMTKTDNSLIFTVDSAESFLSKIADETIIPKHIFQGKTKETLTDEESVIGAGPFKFAGIDKNSGTLTFEKFADYPKADSIYFDKVIFKQYGSQEVLALALKNGEIDLIYDYSKGLGTETVTALENEKNVRLYSQPTKKINKVMFFNNQKMTDPDIKRAIALSIDFGKIRQLFAPLDATPSREGFVVEGIDGYKETPVWERDLQKAKELLANKGYSEQNKFRFELLIHTGSDDTQYASVLKTQIEENGMTEVVFVEKGSDWQGYYQSGNHMASLVTITAKGYDFEAGYGTRYTLATDSKMCPLNPNPVAHGQMITEDEKGNLTEYGKILDNLNNAKTSEELKKAVGNYQDYMVENVLCVPFFYASITYGANAKLDGFKFDATYGILNAVTFETLKKTM